MEWYKFVVYLRRQRVTSYLEIGAREGIALRYLVDHVPTIERVVAVDLPGAKWGRPDSAAALSDNLDALRDNVSRHIYLGDSTSAVVVCHVREFAPFDVVFIDGDHSYDGVRQDYENYAPMGRIVALHDINHPADSKAYGPTKLWNEIKGENYAEIIAIDSRKGIGVIERGEQDG